MAPGHAACQIDIGRNHRRPDMKGKRIAEFILVVPIGVPVIETDILEHGIIHLCPAAQPQIVPHGAPGRSGHHRCMKVETAPLRDRYLPIPVLLFGMRLGLAFRLLPRRLHPRFPRRPLLLALALVGIRYGAVENRSTRLQKPRPALQVVPQLMRGQRYRIMPALPAFPAVPNALAGVDGKTILAAG